MGLATCYTLQRNSASIVKTCLFYTISLFFLYLIIELDWNPPFKGLYNDRQRFIVEMFQHAWKGYKNTAWGHDHSHPISRRYDDWFNVGLTILDALDTTLIMGLEKGIVSIMLSIFSSQRHSFIVEDQ